MIDLPDLAIDLSVVVPILDERSNLEEFHHRLTHVLMSLDWTYEIIYVDDGSSDGSQELCQKFAATDKSTIFVELRRHFGKGTALQAGFYEARGDTLPSRVFNAVTSYLTGIPLKDFNCGFKAYRKEVVNSLDLYGELYRFIPVIAHAKGFRIGEIPVQHHPRRHGKSKFKFERFSRGAFDLLTVLFLRTFRRRPLHFFGLIGFLLLFSGIAINFYLAMQWFMHISHLSNRPLLLFGTLLIVVGVQIIGLGLLAEMITAVTYQRSEVSELIRQIQRSPATYASTNMPSTGFGRPHSNSK
jgi:glycosyltransferase involved in cell wall biosynthesis